MILSVFEREPPSSSLFPAIAANPSSIERNERSDCPARVVRRPRVVLEKAVAEHPNAIRLRAFYDALSAGDGEALLNTHSPDVPFHVPGDGMLAGEYEGIQAVRLWD